MKQMFGTNNHYIQDDGRGHEMIICALWPVNSGKNTGVSQQLNQNLITHTFQAVA